MLKLFVSDLDGTLLRHYAHISEEDKEALDELVHKGIALCIASGRSDGDIVKIAGEIGLPVHRVSQNGAVVHTAEGKLLFSTRFETEELEKVAHVILNHPVELFLYGTQRIYAVTESSYMDELVSRLFVPVVRGRAILEHLESAHVCKLSIFGEEKHLDRLDQELGELFPGQFDAYRSDRDCLDLVPRGVSKGAGLSILAEELGIRPEDVACIGDAFNDVSMFAYTPRSFAMEDAHEDVRAQAAHTVSSVSGAVRLLLG